MKTDKKILYLSPLPPPAGGIATWMKKISSHGLPGNYTIDIVNTGIKGTRPVFAKVRISISEIYRTAYIIFQLIKSLTISNYSLAHINSSLSPSGVLRELFCAYLIKIRGIPLVIHFHGNISDFPHRNLKGLSFLVTSKAN